MSLARSVCVAFSSAVFLVLVSAPSFAGQLAPDLVERLATASSEEKIPAVVVLAEFPSIEARLAEVKEMSKEERRAHVVGTMQELAHRSQSPVRKMLERELAGSFENVRVLWGINGVALSATPGVLERLAELSAVKWVLYDEEIPQEEAIDVDLERVLAEHPPRPGLSEGPFPAHDGDGDGPTGGDASGPNPSATVAGEVIAMGAKQVWDELGYTGNGVIVAVIDSGVDRNHPDLADHIWTNLDEIPGNGVDDDSNGFIDDTWGWNFCSGNNDPSPSGSHGTQVAGQVAGDGTNGTVTGMAPDAEIMALRISCGGPSSWWQSSDYAIANGAHLMTQSYSLKWPSDPDYEAFRRQTDTELAAGVFHANSTGNTGTSSDPVPYNIATPGNVPPPWLHPDQTLTGGLSGVIGSANVNWNTDTIQASSPYGPAAWEDIRANTDANYPYEMPPEFQDYPHQNGAQMGLLKPDLAAYGEGTTSTCPGTGYCGFGGTSSATPHIAGVVALMLSSNIDATPAEVAEALLTTAQHRGDPGKNNRYGAGLVQAFGAVSMVEKSVKYESHSIDDIDGGNGDLAIDAGERVEMLLTLRNTKLDPISNVEAILTSSTPGVEIHNRFAEFAMIPGEGTQAASSPFSLSIDPATCTTLIEFDLEVRFGGDAKVSRFTARVGDEIGLVLLQDDVESGSSGWTVSGSASEGVWETGDPIGVQNSTGTATAPEDDTTAAPGVTAWVTGNGYQNGKKDEDNNDVDGITVLTSPTFAAVPPMVGLDVQFDRWLYANGGTGGGVYRVEASNDGGSNWTVIDEATSLSGGWTRRNLDLLAALAPTATMQLRFTVIDDATDDTVEGGLDELLIDGVRVECQDFTPPGALPPNGVGNTVLGDKLPGGHVRLGWVAPPVDGGHDPATVYRIMRSTAPDSGFSEAGSATATEWTDVDALAVTGVYFYKIVAENAGGQEN